MTTQSSNIEVLKGIAGDLTKPIKANSVAYQVCGVQHSTSRAPLVLRNKKGDSDVSFQIVSKTPSGGDLVAASTNKALDGFSEELIDDVFSIFGEEAIEILKNIAANTLADNLDVVVINHMYDIATKKAAVTYDFTSDTHSELIKELVLKINKERLSMAIALKRGFPKILIVSPGVAALLITNKMIAGNDSDYIAGDKDNVKFVGKMGDMSVYMMDQSDLDVSTEFVIIAHKSYMAGDASMILIPIQAPKANIRRDKETGILNLHYTQKYAYSANPLDNTPFVESQLPVDAIFISSDNSLNSLDTNLSSLFSSGDEVTITGTVSNNDVFVVSTVTNDKVIFTGTSIVDEGGVSSTLTDPVIVVAPTDAIFISADNSVNSVLTDLSSDFVIGETVTITDTASNNDDFVVASISANKVTFDGTAIVDEGTGTATLTKPALAVSPTDTVFLSADNSMNSALTDLSVYFVGESVTISASTSNNGAYIIDTVTADKITFVGTGITDEGNLTTGLDKTKSSLLEAVSVRVTVSPITKSLLKSVNTELTELSAEKF